MDEIKNRFYKALSDFGIDRLIADSDRVIVGFSGGADSRVLLSLLKEYTQDAGKQIVCAHVNHMIRGKDAFEDEEKCVRWANECGVSIRVCRVNVPLIAEKAGKGIEETARDERYRFFESLASEFEGVSLIATAHNADDNLETVIFNLLRGSGTHGMTGIPPVRDGRYIRPMILCSSSSIRDYCRENGIEYNVDCTNNDTDYTRNYIRNSIVPLLCKIVPDPSESVNRMCCVLRTDDDFISSCADVFIKKYENDPISVSDLSLLHDAVLSRVIDCLYRKSGGKRALSKIHFDSVRDAVRNKKGELSLSLPDGIVFSRSGNTFSFNKDAEQVDGIVGKFKITVNGAPFIFGDSAIVLSTELSPILNINKNIYNLSIHKTTDFDKIKGDVFIRGRLSGDSYKFRGMTRKVKKLFSEAKIPVRERESVPLICDDDGILWIPGFPLRDGVSSGSSDNKNIVFLCFYKKDFER